MTALLTIFGSSFVIAFSGAMMPGPLLTAAIANSTKRGFIAGPLLIAGHAVLEIVLIIILLAGLAPFFRMPAVFIATSFAGALILLWMSIGMFRKLPSLTLALNSGGKSLNNPVLAGILMSLSNPYWIIWWASIGTGYIVYSQKFGIPGILFFFTGHILADFLWYSFISAAVAGGRRFFTDRIYQVLIAVCAGFLVVFAGYFFYSGIQKLGEVL
ncbi:MAG: LysE family transporter [Spirochaetes bacterium]|nr:LysE family transporter [Spirochaetota bacterium]